MGRGIVIVDGSVIVGGSVIDGGSVEGGSIQTFIVGPAHEKLFT